MHAQFETIHPFEDGNGRTGRALIHVVFKRRGLAPNYLPPISVALAAAKDRYIAGLTSFRADGAEAWIEHFAGAAAWAVIEILPAHPIITAPVATAVTGRAKAAIYQGFEQLEAAGILVPLSESRRNRAWEAAGLLDLIAGLEAR